MGYQEFEIRKPRNPKEFEAYYGLRRRALHEPNGIENQPPSDELDETAEHRAVFLGQKLLAGARFHTQKNAGTVSLISVDPDRPPNDFPQQLVRAFEEHAMNEGIRNLTLHVAASSARPFQKMGYTGQGNAPALFGKIPQVKMAKTIPLPIQMLQESFKSMPLANGHVQLTRTGLYFFFDDGTGWHIKADIPVLALGKHETTKTKEKKPSEETPEEEESHQKQKTKDKAKAEEKRFTPTLFMDQGVSFKTKQPRRIDSIRNKKPLTEQQLEMVRKFAEELKKHMFWQKINYVDREKRTKDVGPSEGTSERRADRLIQSMSPGERRRRP